MRLDGFGIMVDDMPTMVRFYRDVFDAMYEELPVPKKKKRG